MRIVVLRNLLLAVLLPFLFIGAKTDQQADRLLGHWLFPSKGSSVNIFRVGNRYFARVAEVDQAGERNFGLVKDTVIIRNLRYDGQMWSDGQLIHPKTGIKLSVEVSMIDPQAIDVTIYKGIKLFHRRFNMTRKVS
ncbi:DUF2147 domain-containing protein [Spirosoma agri]|uniref:DUF2147 domain-containing protein n=1 Tax=Spirosoma agri TaxID=1987381 RepID=A0A6M0IQI3_9BACT|nr:DUF2147 domain-containing protein [Spirosoma agri]